MKTLPPIRLDTKDFDELEKVILKIFFEQIYLPIISAIDVPPNKLTNSKKPSNKLLEYIESGKISFDRGRFTGKMNASISKELRRIGAKWDRKQGSFSISLNKLPIEVANSISVSKVKFERTIKTIFDKIDSISPESIASKFQETKIFDDMLYKTEKKFERNIKHITIAPVVTEEMRARIAAEYTNNMQLYIKDFTQTEIKELREKVQDNFIKGVRYESLIGDIKQSYGVSERKAKFLARQESQLLITKYTQERYESAGVDEYIWRCVSNPKDGSPDQHTPGNVRYYHALNNGKKFRWSEGAVVNEQGDKKNPGMDFNCRCVALPVVKF